MVELIDDDHGVPVGRDPVHPVRGEGLNAGEHVLPPFGPGAGDVQLAEVHVVEDLAIGAQRLLQDLLAVRHEEQGRAGLRLSGQPAVVERGDHGLARPGGGDHEVAVPMVDDALHLERVQHVLLMRIGAHVEAGQR